MKKIILLSAIFLTINTMLFPQGVGVNTTGASAAASAMLDVSSTTKGFLPPRMTAAQKTAISSPATGLLVYQTDASRTIGTAGLYIYNGTSWVSFVTGTHYLGESYGGGTVFWVDASGQHGLIYGSSQANIRWYAGTNTNTMARGDGIGAGKMNTALIIASQAFGDTSTYAARVCAELVITSGGVDYGDWYLPSISELDLLITNHTDAGISLPGDWMWSSTESTSGKAYRNFSNGLNKSTQAKNTLHWLYMIRLF